MKYLITENGKEKTYSLPTIWNDVKLDTYMQVCSILEEKEDKRIMLSRSSEEDGR